MTSKSRNALAGPIIPIRRGLAIYRVNLSPFYYVRIRTPSGKHIVRSTKETSRIAARAAAEELAISLLRAAPIVPSDKSFGTFCDKFLEEAKTAASSGAKNPRYAESAKYSIENKQWGLRNAFDGCDVTKLTSADFNAFMRKQLLKRPDYSKSTVTAMTSVFRNIMKIALNDNVIQSIPQTPTPRIKKGLGRPFFRFSGLVPKDKDQYRKLLSAASTLAEEKLKVRGVEITEELYNLIVFCVGSFLRPTYSELYAVKHNDISVTKNNEDSVDALRINILKGKTGARVVTTMPNLIAIYEKIKKHNPNFKADDYIFLNQYQNRRHAIRIIQNQFNVALAYAGLLVDEYTGLKHTMYSLRHTSICFRLVLSKGRVNIFTLAKNAGTSVEIIEKHYAKQLPMSHDLERNLQSFGE